MAHWAEIDKDNKVIRVLVGNNESPDEGESFMQSLGGTWVKTSYNGTIRKQFAAPGFSYDPVADVFIKPKPFDSWKLSEDNDWEPPVALPSDGKNYVWNEAKLKWDLIS